MEARSGSTKNCESGSRKRSTKVAEADTRSGSETSYLEAEAINSSCFRITGGSFTNDIVSKSCQIFGKDFLCVICSRISFLQRKKPGDA